MSVGRRPGRAATIALLLLTSGCHETDVPPPANLEGVWRTTAPGYTDDVLEITPTTIRFASHRQGGPSGVDHPIARVERRTEVGRELYTIVYIDESRQESELALAVEAAHPDTVVFVHQSQLRWTRRGDHS